MNIENPLVGILCQLDYECPMQWDELEKTEFAEIRFCTNCNKDVTFCTTERQVLTLTAEGECVAFEVPLRGRADSWVRIGLRTPKGQVKVRSFTDTL
jgi:hypothetical protein